MVEAEGHSVTEAHDGAQGADLAAREAFDLVLMDINMPVLDGRAATRRIRAEDGASATAPIVALTANAMASEQTELLRDGMTAILTKPLSRDALRAALSDHAPAVAAAPALDVVSPAHSAETRQALGEQAFAKLITLFAQEVDELVDWLEADVAQDYLEVATRSHKVAGSAAVFGAIKLRAHLRALESAAKTGDGPGLRQGIDRLPEVWAETRPHLR